MSDVTRLAEVRARLVAATCPLHRKGGCGCIFYGSIAPEVFADMTWLVTEFSRLRQGLLDFASPDLDCEISICSGPAGVFREGECTCGVEALTGCEIDQ